MSRMHPACVSEASLLKLIPDSTPGADGERRLFRFFRDAMPPDWDVFYNVSISGTVDHQLDFLVLVKGCGILNVDAKGGGYSLRDGFVYLGDSPDPIFQKASGAIHSVDEYVRTHISNGSVWGAFDYLVVFTKTTQIVTAGEENHAFSLLGAERDSAGVAHEMITQMQTLLDRHSYAYKDFARHTLSILSRLENSQLPFVENLKYLDWDRLSERMLTVPQKQVFGALLKDRYCHVKGGAGTGKTLVAVALARRCAALGKRVLYVCFNRSLGHSLKRRIRVSGVSVTSFYSLASVFGRNANFGFGSSFDRSVADARLEAELRNVPAAQKFNVLIVDEAQDLTDRNLRFLLTLLKSDRKVILFSDAEQTIFSYDNEGGWDYDEKSLFQDEPVAQMRLSVNYRNTSPIHARISEYEEEKTISYFDEEETEGRALPVQTISSSEVTAKISELLDRVSPQEIAVLAYEEASLVPLKRFADKRGRTASFTDDIDQWERGGKILKTTVQSFKGLEANVVLLFSWCAGKSVDRLRYVGESRAKYELYIVQPDGMNQ